MCGSTWDRPISTCSIFCGYAVYTCPRHDPLSVYTQACKILHTFIWQDNLTCCIILLLGLQYKCIVSAYIIQLFTTCVGNQVTPEGSFLCNFRCRLFLLQMACVYMRVCMQDHLISNMLLLKDAWLKVLVYNTASRNHCGVTNRIFGTSAKTIGLNIMSPLHANWHKTRLQYWKHIQY